MAVVSWENTNRLSAVAVVVCDASEPVGVSKVFPGSPWPFRFKDVLLAALSVAVALDGSGSVKY